MRLAALFVATALFIAVAMTSATTMNSAVVISARADTLTPGRFRIVAWAGDNGNRLYDPGEPLVAGVLVTASRSLSGQPIDGSAVTGADGRCEIVVSPHDAYQIAATAPEGFKVVYPPGGRVLASTLPGEVTEIQFILEAIAPGPGTPSATPSATTTRTATATWTATATPTPTLTPASTLSPELAR
jgi:hypothetical protein